MRTILIEAVLLFLCVNLIGQNKFTSVSQNASLPHFSFEYSDDWIVEASSSTTTQLKHRDHLSANVGLSIDVSGKLYKYDESGFSMEVAALLIINQDATFDTIDIDGRTGFVLTTKGKNSKEEIVSKDILVDFPQYSMLSFHVSGPKKMFEQHEAEVDAIVHSIQLKESEIPKPSVKISNENFKNGIKIDYANFINDSILNDLFYGKKVVIEGEIEIENYVDLFNWKRSSNDSMTVFESNNLLLYLDWLNFEELNVNLEEDSLEINFFKDKKNILTLQAVIEKPIFIHQIKKVQLNSFYLDYRKKMVVVDNKFVLDDNNNIIEAQHLLINGKVYPLLCSKIFWH